MVVFYFWHCAEKYWDLWEAHVGLWNYRSIDWFELEGTLKTT